MDELSDRIQALPQELFDRIFDYVVAIESNQTIKIDEAYRPPWQLRVTPIDRDSLAPIYFGTSTFVTALYWYPSKKDSFDIVDWVKLQTSAHRQMVKHVNIQVNFGVDSKPSDLKELKRKRKHREYWIWVVKERLRRNDVELPNAEFSVTGKSLLRARPRRRPRGGLGLGPYCEGMEYQSLEF